MRTRSIRTRQLNIHLHRDDDAEDSPAISVYCPNERRLVPIDQCPSCPHCDGLSLDPTDRNSFLMCSFSPPASPLLDPLPGLLDPLNARASDLMTRTVLTIPPELGVNRLTEVLLENNISGVPVVDDEGRPVGIVTKTDLLRMAMDKGESVREDGALQIRLRHGITMEVGPGFHLDMLETSTVGEIMTPTTITVGIDATVSEAAALMTEEGLHRVVVVDGEGRVAGLLSSMDVLRWVAGIHRADSAATSTST